MRRTLLLMGTVASAALVLGQPPSPIPGLSVSAQATERVELREAPPSCQQSIQELGLEDQPVNCIEPPVPTYDPPRMHGQYRVYPESYVGPLTYQDLPDTAPAGVVSDSLQAIVTSSLYAEPLWLPEGYSRSSISTHGYDSEHVITALYDGPGDAIRINRVRQSTWPIDIILPAGESFTIFETPVLAGIPAVLYYPGPGALLGSDLTVMSFVEGDVETTILGDHLDPGTAVDMALSLICGTACAPSSAPAGGPFPDAMSETPREGNAAVDGSAVSPAQMTRTTYAGTSEFVDDEHRVIAGLGITSAKVLQWWNHSAGYGEAALDLQHPNGGPATGGINVYAMTWPWSGNGRMSLSTDNYRHDPSYCDGRYVELKDAGDNVLGRLTYVHLADQAGAPDTWQTNVGAWTIRYLGRVATWQDPNCPWTTIHLHQGQTTASPRITYNTGLPSPPGIIDPTNDAANNWMHKVTLIDSDGDGCSDQEELGPNPDLGGGRDPHNYYDFYDITNITSVIGAKDKIVSGFDLNLILAWGGAREGGPPNPNGKDYDIDYNGNGIPDGREIDYAGIAGPATGPDGGISGPDLNQMLSEGGDRCTAPP